MAMSCMAGWRQDYSRVERGKAVVDFGCRGCLRRCGIGVPSQGRAVGRMSVAAVSRLIVHERRYSVHRHRYSIIAFLCEQPRRLHNWC